MSLDVTLTMERVPMIQRSTGVFVRENGSRRELTVSEVRERWPDAEVEGSERGSGGVVYAANITHNLGKMADAAGIYRHLWRPEEIGITHARDLIEPLARGLALLNSDPPRFEAFNSPNGWGMYEHFAPFVGEYLAACRQYPDAKVSVSR